MEGQSHGTNRVSKTKRIPHRTTEELGAGHEIDGRSAEECEKAIWQEKVKSSRTKGWR